MSPGREYPVDLSRRERQIMDVIFRLGTATASDIHAAIPDPPTYTTVRGLLRILAEKGHVQYVRDGRRYVYQPRVSRPAAGARSLSHVVRTFFSGSPSEAVAALLGTERSRLTDAELERLARLVSRARKKRRPGS
jgi:predicted transcriptional regulator